MPCRLPSLVRRLNWSTVAVLAGMATSLAAPGEAADRYAFLVGVQTYTRPDLRPLKYSDNDIVQLSRALERGGYSRDRMMALSQSLAARDVRYTPFRENILAELRLFVTQIQADDSLVVALAGHGVQFQGADEVYFCPGDADVTRPESLISINSVYELLRRECRARHVLLLVDACRNDPLSNLARSRKVVDLESATRPQQTPVPRGLAVLFSCSEGELAFEHPSLRHGVFFHHVIEGLRGKADSNVDGEITLDELTAFATPGVQNFAIRELRATQTPQLKGEISGVMGLTRVPQPEPIPSGTVEGTPLAADVNRPRAADAGSPANFSVGSNVAATPTASQLKAAAAGASPRPIFEVAPPVTSPGAVPVAMMAFPSPGTMLAYLDSLEKLLGREGAAAIRNPLTALRPHLDDLQAGVLFLDTDGESPAPFVSGFCRVKDVQAFQSLVAQYPAVSETPARQLPLSDGSQLFVREHQGWLFFSMGQVSDILVNPPDDPAAHVAEASGRSQVVTHIYTQNVPAAAGETVSAALLAHLQQKGLGDSGAAGAVLMKTVDLLRRESGRITVTAAIDLEGKVKHRIQVRPLPHTRLAEIAAGDDERKEPDCECPPQGCDRSGRLQRSCGPRPRPGC